MAFVPISLLPHQYTNPATGDVASGYILNAFVAGTTTPANFYDKDGLALGASITLNSSGYPAVGANVVTLYLDDTINYKFIFTDPDTLTEFTVDNISSAVVSGTATFDNTAAIKLESLAEGITVYRRGYYTAGDGAHAEFLIKTAAQAATDGDVIDGYGNHTIANGNVAILQNREFANILQYGATENGAAVETAILTAAITYNGIVEIPDGIEILVDDIDPALKKLFGGGKLSYTTDSAFPGDTINFTNDIVFDGVTIECRQRNRLNIESDNITLANVTEKLNTSDTDAGAYSNVNWQGTETLSITGHRCIDTGLKISETGRFTLTGALIEVNNAGLGVGNGENDGTDGIKVSTGSGTISNVVVKGCSRDIIDGFVSSGSLVIANVESDTFKVNGIELKVQDGNTTSESPFDINISNVTCGSGGIQNSDNFAAILIVNAQTTYVSTTAPRRINISNVVFRYIGAAQTSGQYYGAYIDGSYELNMSNVTLLQADDYGMRIAPDVKKVNLSNCNIHGITRAISVNGVDRLNIANCNIGTDEETGDESSFGIFNSGTSNHFKLANSNITGTTNSIRAENTTIDQFKATNCTLNGAVRIDNGTLVEFHNTDTFSQSSGVNTVAAAQAAGGITYLKYIGGSINDGSRGISYDNLTRLAVIGVAFRNNNSVTFGTPDENNNIWLGNTSESSGSFPSASGSDQIANNIVI